MSEHRDDPAARAPDGAPAADSLRDLAHGDAAPAVGEAFAVELPGAPAFELVLEETLELTAPPAGDPALAPRAPFALRFRGPLDPQLTQGIVPLRHPRLGALAIFLVPIAREADGMRYEAVFS